MKDQSHDLIRNSINEILDTLSRREQDLFRRILQGNQVARNTNKEFDETLTFGQRLADQVASFGGSWTFIMIFASILLSWIILNSFILARMNSAFDPYPYILLNLFLSMLASIQAPIIMMSQKRQAAKDRLDAAHDYEVNMKAELEIADLHRKVDELREKQWSELIEMQQDQSRLLTQLLAEKNKSQ